MSESIFPEMRRALPSFAQWLEENGAGERGAGYEPFAAIADLAMRTLDSDAARASNCVTPRDLCFFRLWQGMLVAAVELCNIEHQKHGVEPSEIITLLPRAFAAGAMYAAASVLRADTPYRSLAKILTEEFRFAAKAAADQLTGQAERAGAYEGRGSS